MKQRMMMGKLQRERLSLWSAMSKKELKNYSGTNFYHSCTQMTYIQIQLKDENLTLCIAYIIISIKYYI